MEMNKKKIGFYLDARRLGDWSWDAFLQGNIGMSGTDAQALKLIYDLTDHYSIYLFINTKAVSHRKMRVLTVSDLKEAATLAKKNNLDLLIFNNRGNAETLQGIKTLNRLEQNFILWDQNGPTAEYENLLSSSKHLKRIVCVSRSHANSHRHKGYFNKIIYIYNGNDYEPMEQDRTGDDHLNIGFVGAVDETKGFHWVAHAWPAIKSALPNATLTVIGSIKTHDKTRATGSLGISTPEFEDKYIKRCFGDTMEEINAQGVKFTGNISPNEMRHYFRQLHLGIVNPNHRGASYETFCVSAIDLQAHRIPVVGANIGGLKETVLHGHTGVLINKSNQLAETVIELLNDRKKLWHLASNAERWVSANFSRKKVTDEWLSTIDGVLENKINIPLHIQASELTLKLVAQEFVRRSKRLLISQASVI